ncbi:Porin D [Ectopseudomonas oleovorans]|uniref:Porin D n=1 Tax=Ectopseudomonas oleovorans (strain CECT 5344) TaxID=1182590 RepID=W6R2L7_ECTO5|nr:Porin D [Pseudomonas oleovorans CECT 5344]CDR93570.1 Porin D [Pseudomonas oleovorans]
MANFESGFTQGTVGFGIDAYAGLGLKLDTGDGRYGPGGSVNMFPVDSDDRAEDSYSKAGAAVKARFADTVVKAGDVFPTTPVVHYGDSRLLPQSFKGVTVVNESIEGLTLQGGRLHAMSQPQESTSRGDFATFYAGQVDSPWVGYFGGDYELNDNLGFSLYSSRLKDAWDQYYAGMWWTYPLSEDLSLFGGLNYYNATDEGKKQLGDFSNNIYSGSIGVKYGAHRVALSHQRNNGDDDFDYLRQSDSIFLDNSLQYSDFNSPKERSWMVRYDLDMADFGVPGLSFMARYALGRDADYSNANSIYMRTDGAGNPLTDQKRWERNLEVKYVFLEGSLKDLSVRVRQMTTRATAYESDLDEVRVIVEYPLQVL